MNILIKQSNYLIDQQQQQNCFNSDTGVSTKSFEHFIKSPSLQLKNDNQQSKKASFFFLLINKKKFFKF